MPRITLPSKRVTGWAGSRGIGRGPIMVGGSLLLAVTAGCASWSLPSWSGPSWSVGPSWWGQGGRGASTSPPTPEEALWERAAAGRALSAAEQAELVDLVAKRLEREPSGWERGRAVQLLGPIHGPHATHVLQQALGDATPEVRIAACRALVQQPGDRAVGMLAGVVANDPDLDVRVAAAQALGTFRQPEAVLALATGLDDRDPAVQYQVMQSMRRAAGQDVGNRVTDWKRYAAQVMLQSDRMDPSERVARQPAPR